MTSPAGDAALSFQVFGEKTCLPIELRQAVIRKTSIPILRKSLVTATLAVVNSTVQKDVTAKLKLALPPSASVKRFEVLRGTDWYPATAVPKQKASAVVYKEKEKKRDVAAISNVGSSNLFEIDISPMPYEVQVKCRLELLVDSENAQHLVNTLASNASEVITDKDEREDCFPSSGGAVVGDSFGKTHFVCKIPPLEGTGGPFREIHRMVILWDTSASQKSLHMQRRHDALKELVELGKVETIELYTFGTGSPNPIGSYNCFSDLLTVLQNIKYDGGTDMTVLPSFFSDLAGRGDAKIDCVLVFTDGMDNLGRTPAFQDSYNLVFPVHCVADADDFNLKCLRNLASSSPSCLGTVFARSDSSYVKGVLIPQPVLRSIKTDQDEAAFLEEVDDGFRCVPDHRLEVLNQPIGDTGLLISGVLNSEGQTRCTVSKLVAVVVLGGETHEFHFKLGQEDSPCMIPDDEDCGRAEKVHHLPTQTLTETNVETSPETDQARILGHIYAEELYEAAELFGLASGMNMKLIQQDLAVSYEFCSPESSLLMLFEPNQFVEHGILPPIGHPAHDDVKIAMKEQEGEVKGSEIAAVRAGEIGGPKTIDQQAQVGKLASDLHTYLTTVDTEEKSKRNYGGSRRGGFEGAGAKSLLMCLGDDEYDLCGSPAMCEACFEDCDEEDDGEEEECCDGGVDMYGMMDFDDGSDLGGGTDMCGEGFEDYERDACLLKQVDLMKEESTEQLVLKPTENAHASVVAPPQDPQEYMEALNRAVCEGMESDWEKLYDSELNKLGGHRSVSPSFFLNTARTLAKCGKSFDAIRIATNCLEANIDDVQMLRSVGYILLSTEISDGVDLSIEVFDKVREVAPCEPQSFLDSSLSRFWKSWKAFSLVGDGDREESLGDIQLDITTTQKLLAHILTHQWASRFNEIEWPALILLHYVAELVNQINKHYALSLRDWPDELEIFKGVQGVSESTHPLRCHDFDLALMVWLAWDTDKTDVDLHVMEPYGKEVYYSNKQGYGSLLSKDFTQGYGPEVYILKDHGPEKPPGMIGNYEVYAKYFSSHQDSFLTGSTSAVVWTIEKNADNEKNVAFNVVRLNTHKQKTHVTTAKVAGEHGKIEWPAYDRNITSSRFSDY